ncbi:MAG: MOSC domain-containing protein [Desulfobulbaceae bacterium]|uniref:MOSC domain-containing protein n=1 Tax=Candidatus Desulfatifera sulfidica TaxID=2841691 RepID=A0A8J6NBX9_9BACT|nr:MOSC domain-containing protein [Candidatus Desulfatifera sulfidica]
MTKQQVGTILSLNTSMSKGVNKKPVEATEIAIDHGMMGDAHAANWHRQISLLAEESIEKMRAKGLKLNHGDFAENITTQGLDLPALPVGTQLQAGEATLEVTQIGKKCHKGCEIFKKVGDCIMPREGIFAKVITPGILHRGDTITVLS